MQAFVERIPWHIEQVIKCKGSNEYNEGRNKMAEREFQALARAYGVYGSWYGDESDENTKKKSHDSDFGDEFKRLVRAGATRFG